MSDKAFRKLVAYKMLHPEIRVVAVGYPSVVALRILQEMNMLDAVFDGSFTTADKTTRDSEVYMARQLSHGKTLDDIARSMRDMHEGLRALTEEKASVMDMMKAYFAEAKKLYDEARAEAKKLDDEARAEAKIRDESRSVDLHRLEKTVGNVNNNQTNMRHDFESAIGQPFEKRLESDGYEDCRVFSMDKLYDVHGNPRAEIDYMVSAVRGGVRTYFCMEVKSVFNEKYFSKFARSLVGLKTLIAEAFDGDIPDPKRFPKFRPQQTELRAYFGDKSAIDRIQPIVGAPYVCNESKAESVDHGYWCWMRTDHGFNLYPLDTESENCDK